MPAQAILIGDAIAPKIEVRGIIYGFVVAQELIIYSGGHVWGDIYAQTYQLMPGGQVHGWFSTLPKEQFWTLLENPQQVQNHLWQQGELPTNIADQLTEEEKSAGNSPHRLQRLREWQQETATAFAQRAELEQTFTAQLESRAGDVMRQASTLRQELESSHRELNEARRQHQNLQLTLHARQAELTQLTHERQQTQSQLDQRVIQLSSAQQQLITLTTEINQLRTQKTALELRLQAALDENSRLSERVQNLESAMQASLQHTAEQEQALIRWQELAERNEVQAKSLQQELEAARFTEQKNSTLITQLREERAELRRQLTTFMAERDRLANELNAQQANLATLSSLQDRYAQTQTELAQLIQERDELLQQMLLHEEMYQTFLLVQGQFKDAQQELNQLQATHQQVAEQHQQAQLLLEEMSQKLWVTQEQDKQSQEQLALLQEQHQQLETQYQETQRLLAKQLEEQPLAPQPILVETESDLWLTERQEWAAERARWQSQLEGAQTEITHWMQLAENPSPKAEENPQTNGYQATIDEVSSQLQKAEKLADEYGDQLRWHKISLQTNQEELAEAEELIGQYETAIAGINALMNEKDNLVAKWKNNVNQLTELLYLAEQRTKKTEAALTQYQEASRLETERLKEQLRHAQARQDSDKAELESFHEAATKQGQHLSHLQATLVEREIGVQKLQSENEEQKRAFYQTREQATARIRALEQELAQTQRKLKDLTTYLERRNRTTKEEK